MLKCMFTGKEIDNLKEFHADDAFGRKNHAEETSKWEQITVTILRDGHPLQLLVGMVSPDVKLEPGDVSIVINKK